MNLIDYFENSKGLGILATSDANGKVNGAIYARPHIDDDGNASFIMADRLSHANLRENPHAAYIFTEDRDGFKGKRLILEVISDESSPEKIEVLRRRPLAPASDTSEEKETFLVTFRIVEDRPLIGK